MASYKVPQDVEADDKLLGPFTFRQFIYLLIVVALGFIAWGLAQLFIGLVIIPLPAILLFGALALPLRKDQPMEIYLAAIVSFYIKPRKRLWDPEGIETLIEITAPKVVESHLAKDLSQNEAEQRLSYLANIVDSGGWAIRGAGLTMNGASGASINNDIYLEAQSATDVLDTNTTMAHNIDVLMDQRTSQMREEARERMFETAQPSAQAQPAPYTQVYAPVQQQIQQTTAPAYAAPQSAPYDPQSDAQDAAILQAAHYDPYPSFQQSVIQPLNNPAHQAEVAAELPINQPQQATAEAQVPVLEESVAKSEPSTSDTEFTTGIINLANNPDYSIETMAHEANRLKKKAEKSHDPDEVVISLR